MGQIRTEVSIEQLKAMYEDTDTYPSTNDVAKKLGITERTLRDRLQKARAKGYDIAMRSGSTRNELKHLGVRSSDSVTNTVVVEAPMSFDERIKVKKLNDELASLREALREATNKAVSSHSIQELIHGCKEHNFSAYPQWLTHTKTHSVTGIPTLFLSDLHFDEVVDPAQINGVNEYNRDIAIKRLQNTFNVTIDILFNKMKSPKYDGMVLILGGDCLSGNIHEELTDTNEAPILVSMLTLADVLIGGIDQLLKKFDKIFIPCVVGNHSRLNKKPKAKNKVYDNYEWAMYHFLARHYRDDDRVVFHIPDGTDALFRVYNTRYLLTHGDQFRGGNAIAGVFSPIMLGYHRKQKKQSSINMNFDVMLVAHFHQYIHTNNLVMNGTTKGYCEYANQCNFPFERPQQALWITHPEQGMIFRTPVFADSYEKKIGTPPEKLVIM